MSDRSVNDVYYEVVRPHPFLSYLLFGVIGLLGYLMLVNDSIPKPLIITGIGFVFLLSNIFGKMRIMITQSELIVGFSFLKHRIALDNIDYVEVRNYPWYYGGFGVRYGLDWSVAYVQNYRRGVWVEPRRGRKLFFSSNRPEEIVRTLDEMMAHAI